MSATHLIIYHADCLDGFAAAWAAHRRLGDAADFLPLHHGEAWDRTLAAGRQLYILDFSFPPEQLRALARLARSVVQLDHHASAREPWAAVLHPGGNDLEEYRDPELPLTVRFAARQSGARLAWQHFHPGQQLPLLLQHIEDVDLWRFALPNSRAIQRSLRLQAFDFTAWDKLVDTANDRIAPVYQKLLTQGEAIEAFFRCEIERLAGSRLVGSARLRGEPTDPLQALRHGQISLTDGEQSWQIVDGVAINCDALFASELGNELALRHQCPVLIWQLASDRTVRASLRSVGACDVARIAGRYGGGGHRNAAGFRLPAQQFFSEVLGLI